MASDHSAHGVCRPSLPQTAPSGARGRGSGSEGTTCQIGGNGGRDGEALRLHEGNLNNTCRSVQSRLLDYPNSESHALTHQRIAGMVMKKAIHPVAYRHMVPGHGDGATTPFLSYAA